MLYAECIKPRHLQGKIREQEAVNFSEVVSVYCGLDTRYGSPVGIAHWTLIYSLKRVHVPSVFLFFLQS